MAKLNAHPELRSRFESILSVVGDDGGDLKAMDKRVEHYGVLLPETTIRRITERHAQGDP